MGREGRSWRAVRGAAATLVCAGLVLVAVFSFPPLQGLTSEPQAVSPPDQADPVPVLLVTFDELPVVSLMDRRGEIDRDLFPNFAALQQTSTWYRNASTVAELTRAALPSILTGLDPQQLSLSLGGRVSDSIFTMLEDTHEVRASRAFPTLCRLDVCPPIQAVDVPDHLPLSVFGQEARGKAFVSFLEALEGVEAGERPCLCVLHLVMPHSPWRYLPTGQQYPGTDPMPGQVETPGPGRRWVNDPWLVELAHARHLLQLGFVDRLLGLVTERLRETDAFDETLIAVVADHGIAFRPGRHKRAATPATLGDVAYVPLLIKAPGQVVGAVEDRPAETIDVLPTIADHLNLVEGVTFDGASLRKPVATRTRRVGGEYLSADATERDAALRRKFDTFPQLWSWSDLLQLAPEGAEQWLGIQVPSGSTGGGRATARVSQLEEVQNAGAQDPLIPALVEGELRGSDPRRPNVLLVALDGRIVAATRTYSVSGRELFYALIPASAYVDPPHEMQLLRVTPAGALAPVEMEP